MQVVGDIFFWLCGMLGLVGVVGLLAGGGFAALPLVAAGVASYFWFTRT
ncbi:MAG TPA: hypothetical protein VIG24_02265 [Acidimicrobiia bacterium]